MMAVSPRPSSLIDQATPGARFATTDVDAVIIMDADAVIAETQHSSTKPPAKRVSYRAACDADDAVIADAVIVDAVIADCSSSTQLSLKPSS
jgi:hypothetical protein